MTPGDLVVFLENAPGSGARLAYAAELAGRWQAHLIATFVAEPLALHPHAGFAVGDALASMLAGHRERTRDALTLARAEFEQVTHRRSFTAEWRASVDEPGEVLMLHARHAGIAVLGPPATQRAVTTILGLSERMVFASGRPCLLVPVDWPSARLPGRIVVGWNGSREATRAIADAMPFLVAARAVHLVVVPEARHASLYGADPGADMAAHLARQGVAVVLDQCVGDDAGTLLLARCDAHDADLLVMGARGRMRIGDMVFGGATETILARARRPLLLAR